MAMIKVTVNGRELETEAGKSLLETCLDNGFYIPHLCHHNELHPIGACRLCLVEIDGMEGLQTSCTVEAEDGMSARTESDAIKMARRLAIELMLSGHQADCGTCVKYLNCELQSLKQYLVEDELRVGRRSRLFDVTESNPLFKHEPNKCVLCGRCIRACRELRGVGILYYKHNREETYIGVGPDPKNDLSLTEAGCRFCGACAEVCPTGAIMDKDEFGRNKSRKEALLPCANTCPAEIDIPGYVRFVREGDPAAAAALIREKVPFPLVLGYVCGHPCESVCRRGQVSEPISICRLKRYAAESAKENNPAPGLEKKADTGKSVAVIGAGPAGLTAAYYLTLAGHSVTVYETLPEPGGMLRYGIPEYRLPTGVLDADLRHIKEAGVDIQTNTRIESIDELLAGGADSVLITVGTHEGVRLRIPGAKGDGVLVSTEFLRAVRMEEQISLGGRVMVLGGGNVAFDCARVALRLGAKEVMLACLESPETMPASKEEVAAGVEEGVRLYPSRSFRRIIREDGNVTGVQFLNVTSLAFNEDNVPLIETDEDSEHTVAADTVIFAVGQRPGLPDGFGIDKTDRGLVDVNPSTMATFREGVFAASDAVTGTDSVISAIASGRKAAQAIDKYLGGRGRFDRKLAPEIGPERWLGTIDGFAGQTRAPEKQRPPEERVNDFCIVELCLEDNEAAYEAGRCLQCDLRMKMKPEKFWSSY